MDSIINNSSEDGMKKCEKLFTHRTQKSRKSKGHFKSPIIQKRFKTETETTNSEREEKALVSSCVGKENVLRRSKRQKFQNSKEELRENSSFDDKKIYSNDKIESCEKEGRIESCGLNLISDNVIKSLDNTFFSEDNIHDDNGANKIKNSNVNCREDMSEENEVFSSAKEINKSPQPKMNDSSVQQSSFMEDNLQDGKMLTKMITDQITQNITNKPLISNIVNSKNGNTKIETHLIEDKTSNIDTFKNSGDTKNEEKCDRKNIILDKVEEHQSDIKDDKRDSNEIAIHTEQTNNNAVEKLNEENSAKSINDSEENNIMLNQLHVDIKKADEENRKLNEENSAKSINDSEESNIMLDELHVDIKKADEIINSLVNAKYKKENYTQSCRVNKNITQITTSKDTLQSSKIECTQENLMKSDTCDFEPSSLNENNLENSNGSFESRSSTFGKKFQIFNESLQKNMHTNDTEDIKNKITEKSDRTEDSYPNYVKEKLSAEDFASHIKNTDQTKVNLTTHKHLDEVTASTLDKSSSSELFNCPTISNNESKPFYTENTNSSENNASDESSMMPKTNLNDKNITCSGENTEIDVPQENLKFKEKKLTLLYMSALDYEKENKENVTEMLFETKDTNNDSLQDNSTNSNIYTTQENLEICKQDSNNIFKKIDEPEENKKLILSCQIDNDIKEDKKLSPGKENDLNSLEINYAADNVQKKDVKMNDLDSLDSPDSNKLQIKEDKIIMKNDLTDNKDDDDQTYYSKQQRATLKFDKNTPLSQSSLNDASLYEEELNNEVKIKKNEETDKCDSNKYFQNTDLSFLVSARDCFKSEGKKSSVENEGYNANESMTQIDESIGDLMKENTTHYMDAEECFDLEDDFELTKSQIDIIELNENNELKQSSAANINSNQQTESCSNTHFGSDSITVEIIEQLCYIRETVESVKKLLITFLKTNEDMKNKLL